MQDKEILWVSTAEISRVLHRDSRTLRKWASLGLIPAQKLGARWLFDFWTICHSLNDGTLSKRISDFESGFDPRQA